MTAAVESRSVIVRLQAEVSQYRNDIRAAGKDTTAAFTSAKVAAKEVGVQSTASQKAMRDVGTAAATSTKRTADASRTATQSAKKDAVDLEKAQTRIFAAGALTLGAILKTAADFDQAMSSVQAATHESADNMDLLRTAAIDAGARTTFSATEAAGAIENLAKAGVSTADILNGALDGALSLAAAGTLEVADAAEFVATALTQFQLKGDQATHVADLLAAGAGKAQGEVSDMALALDYAGVPAANLGVSIEQTAGTIALFAKNGIIGEKAGTGLRGMLASLTSPSKVAAQEMKNLGLRVFDAHGNFIGLDGVAGQLHQRLGKLTQEERANALGKIFGNEQLQAANVLYREGAKGVHEWTAQVNDAGYAADTAAIKQDNLKGDVEKLGGAFSSLFISAGEGAQGPLRGLTQELTNLVDTVDGLPDPVKAAGVVLIAAATAAVGLSLAATRIGPPFLQARTSVALFAKTAVTDLGNVARYGRLATESSARLGGSFRTLGKGALVLGGLAVAASGLDDKLGLTNTTMFGLMGLIAGPWGAAIGAGAGLLVDFAHAGDASKRALKGLDDELQKNQGNLVIQQQAIDQTRAHFEELQKDFYNDSIGATLRHAFSPEFWNEAASSVGKGTSAYQDQLDQVNKLAEGNGQLQESLFYIGSALGQDFGSGNPSLEDLTAVATRAKPALDALGISLDDLSSASLSTDGRASIARQIIAWMQYSDSAEGRTDALAASVAGMGNKMETTADKAKSLGDALDALLSPNLNLSEATDKWTTALRHLDKDLAKHGRSLKGNSDAAIANRAAIRDRITQLSGMLKAEADAGASSTELAKTLRGQKQALIDAGVAAGLSKSELKDYLREMGLTPALVQTVIQAVGVDQARAGVRGLKGDIDALHDKHVTISAEVHRTRLLEQTGPAVASGGQVFGPGTTTSDSIPARLSNREFVVRAAAVDHYGADFFHRANSMRLAEGGLATTTGVRRYEAGNFRQVPTIHATSGGVAEMRVSGVLNTPWGPAQVEGIARAAARDEVNDSAALDRTHAGMYRGGVRG